MLALLAKLIIALGVGALIGLVIKVVILTLKAVLTKVKEQLRKKFGRKAFIASVGVLGKQMVKEAEQNGNIHDIDELLKELGDDGVAMGFVDENGSIDEKDIEIISAEKLDDGLDRLLKQNNGEIVIK